MLFQFLRDDSKTVPVAKIKYLRLFYYSLLLIFPFYVIKNYFQFHTYKWNVIIIPLYIAHICTPLFARWSGNYNRTAFVTGTIPIIFLGILIYEAGGLNAPGLVWLTIIPATYGILLGRRGGIFGACVLAGYIIFLKMLENYGYQGDIAFTPESYLLERTIDLCTYSVYIIIQIQYFIHNEEDASQQLQEYTLEIENLLRIVVHDLSTPMTISTISLKQIQNRKASAEQFQSALRRIGNGLDNASKILQQVKLLKALHDGKQRLSESPIAINPLFEKLIELIAIRAQEKSLRVTFKPCPTNPTVWGDELILRNVVLANFLTNAIKFSHPESSIDIETKAAGDQIIITIQDYGIGIPPPLIEEMWSLKTATSRPGTQGETGTGYGMPLAKEFTEKMRGKIEVFSSHGESNSPSGTRVKIIFPAQPLKA